jgi:Fic family protein
VRRYEQTHPWVTFRLDLNEVDLYTWLLLGEAESKCEHIAGVPLQPEVAHRLHTIYLSKGVHATTSIEGNTLSEAEVLALVEGNLQLPKSRQYLAVEIENIVRACNEIVRDVREGRPLELTPARVAHFNELVLRDLPLDDDVVPGKIRMHQVGVARYRGAPPEDCEYLLDRLCRWIMDELRPPDGLVFPINVLKSILAHLYIAWIHPFGDGNGRTARLIEFQLMVQAGVPVPSAHLLSDHYNRTRDAYYRELARTSKPDANGRYHVEGFVKYAMQGFVDELREQIEEVRRQQMKVIWEHYVHSLFHDKETPANRRQKHLVLDLPGDTPVPVNKIPEVSPRVAREYAGKTHKAVTRDLNALGKLRLIRRTRQPYSADKTGVVANRQIIEAFLPIRREG